MQQSTTQQTELVEKLKALYGERLLSACLYGPAISETSAQEIHALVIVKQLTLADLEKAGELTLWWEKKAKALPIFLSEEEWRHSADVFALEYADVRDRHRVIHGPDVFADVEVEPEALRLICELEIYRKLIFLRQRLLLYRDKPSVLLDLMLQSIHPMAVLCRGILRLHVSREDVPHPAAAVFERLPSVCPGLDIRPMLRILRALEQKNEIPKAEARAVFAAYIEQIGLLNQHLNQ